MLTAVFGTAIIASQLQHIFRAQTTRGLFIRELLVDASVAFLLGTVVHYKWKVPEAKWIWVVGVCGFAWRVTLGAPQTIHEEVDWFTLGLVSLRAVFYSLGALCCQSLMGLFSKEQPDPLLPTADP